MKLPEYVPKDEVKRECKELGIRNWAALKKLVPSLEEAKIIRAAIGAAGIRIGIEDFRGGLEVELEHGTKYPKANVTNNHPVLTGKIVIAHLKETLDYYRRHENHGNRDPYSQGACRERRREARKVSEETRQR